MKLKYSLKELAKRGRLPFYIDNDGRPVGETQCHVENVCYLLEPLEEWFRADPQVFVAGAMVLHYFYCARYTHDPKCNPCLGIELCLSRPTQIP